MTWLCITNFLYYYVKVSKRKCKPNMVGRMKLHATIRWHDLWSRDHMLYHKFHEDTITKLGWNTYANKMMPLLYDTWFIISRFLYSYMSFLYVMLSRNLLKLHSATSKKTTTTKHGGNTYKNINIAKYHRSLWLIL